MHSSIQQTYGYHLGDEADEPVFVNFFSVALVNIGPYKQKWDSAFGSL
jgi:hypothetical protein